MTLADRILTTVRAHVGGIAPQHLPDALDATDRDTETAVRLLLDTGQLRARPDGRLVVTSWA